MKPLEGFAILPDGQSEPAAVFHALEDAIEWGLTRFGGDHFRIAHVTLLEPADEPRPTETRNN